MSSYEWKNMSQQAQKANKEFGELSREEIRKAGEEEVDKVEKALKAMEPFNDVFEVRGERGRTSALLLQYLCNLFVLSSSFL